MKKKHVKIIIIAIIVALVMVGMYFLSRRQYKITDKLDYEVDSVLQAYLIAENYAEENFPESKLLMYGVGITGKEAIMDREPQEYLFFYDVEGERKDRYKSVCEFYITIDSEKDTMRVQHFFDVYNSNRMYAYPYPVVEIDVDGILKKLDSLLTDQKLDEIVEKYLDTKIAIGCTQYGFMKEDVEGMWDVGIITPEEEMLYSHISIEN